MQERGLNKLVETPARKRKSTSRSGLILVDKRDEFQVVSRITPTVLQPKNEDIITFTFSLKDLVMAPVRALNFLAQGIALFVNSLLGKLGI